MMRRRFIKRGGPKRKYAWGGARLGGTTDLLAETVGAFWIRAPAGALDNTFDPPQLVEPDNTLIRIRAVITFATNNGGSQLTQAANWAFGIIAWDGLTDNPADVGLLPHPSIDQSLDWVHRYAAPLVQDNTAVVDNASTVDAYQSKAQRKLSNGTGLLFVYGYTTFPVGGEPSDLIVTIAADFRYLVKLP